ncbi:uncharacterized protein BDZ99DRAFT_456799 [Mytilinidion resinicola]|uniref:Uncharacterized protein n=1 Tax=Mytilinidion resinicola TaxID=574789 RepID=A0A6A6Z9P1_9PEZI|nr:uncharacterized protein BDZ99DRAFT_456799 [Mytilinidion resinicola]KAF2816995.1 hypothetical protein BDZ99DRAFT_456799 [Mytilinidion resinicola]
MSSYQITEPHPSVPASNYYHAGRGGAGNIARVNPKSVTAGPDATGPASVVKITPPPQNAYFMSGRGGAGNLHREKERAIFSFDEELAQQQRLMEHAAPVYHIGRGGAGNEVHDGTARTNSASSTLSADSHASRTRTSIEGAWHRVSKNFSRN